MNLSDKKFVIELNQEFSKKPFDKWYIDDIAYNFKGYEDLSYKIFTKYHNALNYKNFMVNIDEDEAKFIESILDANDNILIRAYENYLLASCKTYYKKSRLIEITKELIELYFQNITKIDGGLPSHNLLTILRWVSFKFPKNNISDFLYEKLINNTLNIVRGLSLIGRIIHEIQTDWFFTSEQYINLYKKYIPIEKVEIHDVYMYYDEIKEFLNLPFSKDILKSIKKDLCDYTILNIVLFDDYHKQVELQVIRKMMDELKSYKDEDYAIIDKHLEDANKKALESLQSHDIPLDKDMQEQFNMQVKRQEEEYSSLTGDNKIVKLMLYTNPLNIENIKKSIDSRKNSLVSLCNERVLDDDGRVINFEDLNEDEHFSLKASQDIHIHVDVYMSLIFTPFYRKFVGDDYSSKFIENILTNNRLVNKNQIGTLEELFIDFFNADYKHSVYGIIEEFEDSLRYFLKNEGMNIKKTDGSGDYIGLTSILNNFKNNSFRDKLLEYIDEDYYFTLKWLLTDKYGFDLRDKIAHRFSSKKLYGTSYAIYTVIQIFRLYWGLQKN